MNQIQQTSTRPNYVRAIAGTIAGAVLGYLGFFLMVKTGFYAMVVPGTMIGIGCGTQSGARSLVLGIMAALFAMSVSVFIEWKFFPFIADDSFRYFLTHLNELKAQTTLLIAAGTFAGFWFGRGR